MRTLFYICFSLVFSIPNIFLGQTNVRFSGDAPEWAGYNIVFNRTKNFIIPETEPFIVLQIGQDGTFDFSFYIEEITFLFADVGRFKAYIYVEPDMNYSIVFPPFELKTESQNINPHFQPEEIPFGIKNSDAQTLNRNIFQFNEEFDNHYNTNATTIFKFGNKDGVIEKIEASLEEQFTFQHPFFIKHKELSYMKLRFLSERMKERQYINVLSQIEPAYNMPIYWEVFKSFVSGFLPRNFSGTSDITLSEALNSNMRFDSLTNVLISDTIFSKREFAEICILFTLYESFYSNAISKSVCLNTIKSAYGYAITVKNREFAYNFYKKMTLLQTGTAAPQFALYNKKGKTKELKDYQGKFVYLNFMHTNNYACLNDLMTIENLEKILKKDIEILTIVINDDIDEMIEFLKKNQQYRWEFLHFGAQQRIVLDYNIKAVPLYYLIDPKGNLTLSPAPAPNENFLEIFTKIFQEHRRDSIRKNQNKEKSIFDW